MSPTPQRRAAYCPKCDKRLFDRLTATEGEIEVKCPRCHRIVRINLAKRRVRVYRRTGFATRCPAWMQRIQLNLEPTSTVQRGC